MQKRWLKLAALPVAVGLVAAACGDDDDSGSSDTTEAASDDGGSEGSQDFAGAEVTITGPERSDADLVAVREEA